MRFPFSVLSLNPSVYTMSQPQKLTPMFEQYMQIKEANPGCLLFYRMGDFYELFFEDAEIAARELQIALTSRNPNAENPVSMCGVPWHAAVAYINQLVNKGYFVAICDQTEDPRAAKGLVKRDVTRVVTPGTTIDEDTLDANAHSYLAAAFWNPETEAAALVWADVSTGQWSGVQLRKLSDLWQWILKMAPRELLVPEGFAVPPGICASEGIIVAPMPLRSHFDPARATDRVLAAQGVQELGAVGLDSRPEMLRACGALLAYLEHTQMQNTQHLAPFAPMDTGRHLVLDEVTERNLEIFRRLDGKKGVGTLRHVLDRTQTPMGGRLLEDRLRNPWRDAAIIRLTQDAVEWLLQDEHRDPLREALRTVYDIERLSTRITLNRTSPQDLNALRLSLATLPAVQAAFKPRKLPTEAEVRWEHLPEALRRALVQWDDLADVSELLTKALVDSPPTQITDGGLFRAGYNHELDELMDLAEHGEARLNALLAEEQATCPKLKLGFNRVFGYFFELSRATGGPPPAHFVRRQTLSNAERFTTPRLAELEERLVSATDKRKSLEYKLFQELREKIAEVRPRLILMGHVLAQLDYCQSLAEVAARNEWARPTLDDSQNIRVREGRHPVVEAITGRNSFVPNDLTMDEKRRLLLITGPNMAGKSTILRQTALICLLAQTGSFVPAREAHLGLCDRIFSRVGASDNLAQGQSTFMVEMMETARILRQSTRRSLVILDEIGRGTSTFDGLALAWAVAEELSRRAQGSIRTLFATHYHELTALEGALPGVHTMNIAIQERGNDIVFLRRLMPGPSNRSYGIEVARLAGVPQTVVSRAKEILVRLEKTRPLSPVSKIMPELLPGVLPGMEAMTRTEPKPDPVRPEPTIPVEHPLVVALKDLSPETMTPLEALNRLTEWKQLWGNA